jgi:hypothetical protein
VRANLPTEQHERAPAASVDPGAWPEGSLSGKWIPQISDYVWIAGDSNPGDGTGFVSLDVGVGPVEQNF